MLSMGTLLAILIMGLAVGLGVFGARTWIVGALDRIERDLTQKLRRLRAPTDRLRLILNVWLGAIGCAFVLFWLVLDNLIFAGLISALLFAAPWYVVKRMTELRRRKMEDQMADAMITLASAVRSGLSLAQALEILVEQCPAPLNAEFRQIVAEYKLGKPLEQTLTEAKRRLASENFALFAASVLVSHQSGGRLNETVERIAQSALELQRLERKVLSETAQARKSAVYMALAPLLILVVYYFVDPENTRLLFVHPFGQCVLAICVILNVAAYFWARWLLHPDI